VRSTHFAGLTVAAVIIASTASSLAQECPVPDGADPKLGQVDARERVAFLRTQLGAQARYAHHWANAWFTIYTATLAATVTMAAVADTVDDARDPLEINDRRDKVIAAAFSILAPIGVLFSLRVGTDGPRFLLLDHLDTEASRCVLVRRGEQFMDRDAKDEASRNGWLTQGLLIGVNVALGLAIGAGYGHWLNGAINFAGGMLIGELQFATQPTGLIGAWKRYQAGELGSPAPRATLRIAPQLSTGSVGLGVAGTF